MTASFVYTCAGYKPAHSGQSEVSLETLNIGIKVEKCGVPEGTLPAVPE